MTVRATTAGTSVGDSCSGPRERRRLPAACPGVQAHVFFVKTHSAPRSGTEGEGPAPGTGRAPTPAGTHREAAGDPSASTPRPTVLASDRRRAARDPDRQVGRACRGGTRTACPPAAGGGHPGRRARSEPALTGHLPSHRGRGTPGPREEPSVTGAESKGHSSLAESRARGRPERDMEAASTESGLQDRSWSIVLILVCGTGPSLEYRS